MPETDLKGAYEVIQRLDSLICNLEIMEQEKLDWGIAEINQNIKDVRQLLHNAEEAAFEAVRNYDKKIIDYKE